MVVLVSAFFYLNGVQFCMRDWILRSTNKKLCLFVPPPNPKGIIHLLPSYSSPLQYLVAVTTQSHEVVPVIAPAVDLGYDVVRLV